MNGDFSSGGPRVPGGLRLYAIGDVHGRADLLEDMLGRIAEDRKAYSGEAVAVLLGDYVDRGPQVRETLDILLRPLPDMRMICLRGNHEEILLRILKDHSDLPGWVHYGGLQTLRSYGLPVPAAPDLDDMLHLQRDFAAALPRAHLHFIKNLGCTARFGDYFFVHAGIDPGKPFDRQTPDAYLWMREPFLSSAKDFGMVVVHGHSIRMKAELRPNRIGIDTGAYATGKLTCLVLQDGEQRFMTT